ncbi:MAG: DDE-type integrase/transposase/recombinase, partial [Solirubrobacterales bacterium]|nr:DDE-type integrase/transposase/recombinase [Solirubrobacterales bacterium]
MTPRRAGCAERCTSGSEGGPRKRTGRKADTAPRSDPYTYLRTWEGWLYLCAVQDAFSRRIVGWSMTDHMRSDLVVDALSMAIARRQPEAGLIHHSDQGSLPGLNRSSQQCVRGVNVRVRGDRLCWPSSQRRGCETRLPSRRPERVARG